MSIRFTPVSYTHLDVYKRQQYKYIKIHHIIIRIAKLISQFSTRHFVLSETKT